MDDQTNEERAPLLAGGDFGSSDRTLKVYEEQPANATNVENHEGPRFIACSVCKDKIDISNKKDTFVVKCNSCNEATPIRKAPPKKRYIRCSCKCLLICFENAQRIVCPRSNCKKIITVKESSPKSRTSESGSVASPGSSQQQRSVPVQNSYLAIGQYRTDQQTNTREFNNVGCCWVICGHCDARFPFNTLTNSLARCSSCRQLSSVGKEFSRYRGLILMVLSLMFVGIGLGVQFGAKSYSDSYLVIALYSILYVISVILLLKSIYYLSMKISYIDSQRNSAM